MKIFYGSEFYLGNIMVRLKFTEATLRKFESKINQKPLIMPTAKIGV